MVLEFGVVGFMVVAAGVEDFGGTAAGWKREVFGVRFVLRLLG